MHPSKETKKDFSTDPSITSERALQALRAEQFVPFAFTEDTEYGSVRAAVAYNYLGAGALEQYMQQLSNLPGFEDPVAQTGFF